MMEETAIHHIRRIMFAKKVTIKDLAAKAGISRTGLSQILNGHKSPTLATLEKICTALRIGFVIYG